MTTSTLPFAGTYTADPVHSSFGFAVRYQGVSLFKGSLGDVSATLADGSALPGSELKSPSQIAAAGFRGSASPCVQLRDGSSSSPLHGPPSRGARVCSARR